MTKSSGTILAGEGRPEGRSAWTALRKSVLHAIGIFLIVAWLVLWLAVKITFAAVHLLLLLGVAMILVGLLRAGKTA